MSEQSKHFSVAPTILESFLGDNEFTLAALRPSQAHPDDGMVQSIRQYGVLAPLLCVPEEDSDSPYKFRVVDGLRRQAASQAAGMKSIPLIVWSMDPTTADVSTFMLNTKRSRNEVAELKALENVMGRAFGTVEISKATGIPKPLVEKLLKLRLLVPGLRELFDTYRLTVNVALKIVNNKHLESRQAEILEYALTKAEKGKLLMKHLNIFLETKPASSAPSGELGLPNLPSDPITIKRSYLYDRIATQLSGDQEASTTGAVYIYSGPDVANCLVMALTDALEPFGVTVEDDRPEADEGGLTELPVEEAQEEEGLAELPTEDAAVTRCAECGIPSDGHELCADCEYEAKLAAAKPPPATTQTTAQAGRPLCDPEVIFDLDLMRMERLSMTLILALKEAIGDGYAALPPRLAEIGIVTLEDLRATTTVRLLREIPIIRAKVCEKLVAAKLVHPDSEKLSLGKAVKGFVVGEPVEPKDGNALFGVAPGKFTIRKLTDGPRGGAFINDAPNSDKLEFYDWAKFAALWEAK